MNLLAYEEDLTYLNEITIVMERATGISLDKYIKINGPMQIPMFKQFGEKLVCVVSDLHRMGVIHRDISPMNIFIDVQDSHLVKLTLIDLGLAYIRGFGIRHKAAFTQGYAPPQAVHHLISRIETTYDIYSVGAILHFVLTGSEPYNIPILINEEDEQGYLGIHRDDLPCYVKEQIRVCLKFSPKNRPTSAANLRCMFREKGW